MAFYLSPASMYQRVIQSEKKNNYFYDNEQNSPRSRTLTKGLIDSHEVYFLCTKQYLGLGILLQFIPGTNANKARTQFSEQLEPVIKSLRSELKWEPNFYFTAFFMRKADRASLYSYFNFSPLYRLLSDIVGQPSLSLQAIVQNSKMPLVKIFYSLPILRDIYFVNAESDVSDFMDESILSQGNTELYNCEDLDANQIIFRKNALTNVVHSLLNPFRIVDDLLKFLNKVAYKLLAISSENPSMFRIVIKGIVGLIFEVIRFPIKIAKHMIDLPLSILEVLIVDPVVHFFNSIQAAFLNWDNKVLVVTTRELQDTKELRRAAKQRDDTSYSKMTNPFNYTQKYIGITKKELYSMNNDETTQERIVAIRAPSEKINVTISLLAIVNFFGSNQKTAKNEPEAIEAAKAVLSIN